MLIEMHLLFVCDVNALHEEWLESSTKNLHGRTARDFASLSGCEIMVTEPMHIDGGVLDLVRTNVPDLVGVRVDSSVRTSNHSAVITDVVR